MLRIWAECRISDLETCIFNVVKGEKILKLIFRNYPSEICSSKRNLGTKSDSVMAPNEITNIIIDKIIQINYT